MFRFLSSSALYVTGNKAQNTIGVVVPYLDFEQRIQDKKKLQECIRLRELNLDLEKVEKRWNFYKMIDETKQNLEASKSRVAQLITELMKDKNAANQEEIEKLKFYAKIVKDDLRNVKDYLYSIEEDAVITALSLPNDLHPETPERTSKEAYTFLNKPSTISISHMDIAQNKNYLTITDHFNFYLKKDAALFEMLMLNYWSKSLREKGFTKLSAPYFSRSAIVEGVGKDFENKLDILTLEAKQEDTNLIHLTGGASITSFMAYFTRHLLNEKSLPIQLFTTGKNYVPPKSQPVNLFNYSQDTQITAFVATLDSDDQMNAGFVNVLNIFKNVCEKLGNHFRIIYVAAPYLEKSESLRASIEMFSSSEDKYIEVGNVAIYDNYLSKRLMMVYTREKERKFCKVVTGSVSVYKILGCLLENKYVTNEPLLNPSLVKYCV